MIVAAGGDGTVTAIASRIVGTEKVLALLPFGTANLLARDLKVPLELGAAIAALPTMVLHRIDVGELSGRIFLHKVVVGTFPEIAALREEIRHDRSWQAKFSFFQRFVRRVRNANSIVVEIKGAGQGPRLVRV